MIPQSTNRIFGDTNNKLHRIINRFDFTVTYSTAEAVGVSGTTTVTFPDISAGSQPVVSIFRWNPAAQSGWRPIPITSSSGGSVLENTYFEIDSNASGQLIIKIYSYS